MSTTRINDWTLCCDVPRQTAVWGHILTWTFFLVLVWWAYSLSLSKHFRYILYRNGTGCDKLWLVRSSVRERRTDYVSTGCRKRLYPNDYNRGNFCEAEVVIAVNVRTAITWKVTPWSLVDKFFRKVNTYVLNYTTFHPRQNKHKKKTSGILQNTNDDKQVKNNAESNSGEGGR